MKRHILGSSYSVDLESKDVYLKNELYHRGDDFNPFTLTIDGKDYKVDVIYAFTLALYEIHFKGEESDYYFSLIPKPIKYRKVDQRSQDTLTWVPTLVKPLERDGYRLIPAYPRYEINAEGEIRVRETKEVLNQKLHKGSGYMVVPVRDPRKKKWCNTLVQRLLAFAWKENIDYTVLTQVNHKDGNKTHNFESNVEWCTQKVNIVHSMHEGLKEANKYLIKDLTTGEIKGPVYLSELNFNTGELNQWMKRRVRTKPFKGRYDVIVEGNEWEVKLGEKKYSEGEHAHKGVQVKDVAKWKVGDEDWLTEYATQKLAAQATGCDQGRISRLLRDNKSNQLYNGYCFRMKSDDPWGDEPEIPHGQSRRVRIIYDDGKVEEYDNLELAAKAVYITGPSLGRRIRRGTAVNGFRAEFID